MHANEEDQISTPVCPHCQLPISGDENILICEDCGCEGAEDCCIRDGLCEDCEDCREYLERDVEFLDEDEDED